MPGTHIVTNISLVDLVVDAAKLTRSIYERNGLRLAARDHTTSAVSEFKRAALMEALAADEHLCEMLAGRLHQLGHGRVPDVKPEKT